MKLLDNESSSGLLDLSPDVLQGLQDKQTEAAEIAEESLLHGPIAGFHMTSLNIWLQNYWSSWDSIFMMY